MIYGAREWNDRKHHYSQENNPQEEMLRKLGISDWLETCGPTAAVNCLAAMGYDIEISAPGSFRPQPESILSNWFHDPRNYPLMEDIRGNTPPYKWMGNRIPQYYPPAVHDVFNVLGEFRYLDHDSLKIALMNERAVQVCLKNPSHYISVLAYDDDKENVIFNDPYPSRRGLQNRGFNERIHIDDLCENMQSWGIIYG